MYTEPLFFSLIVFFLGTLIGCIALALIQRLRLSHFKQLAADILNKAAQEGEALKNHIELAGRQQQIDQQREFENRWQQERRKIQIEDERIKLREDNLEARMNLVDKKIIDLEKREAMLVAEKTKLEEDKKGVVEMQQTFFKRLEQLTGLSAKEAKEILFNEIIQEVKKDAANYIRKTTKEATEEAEKEASKIIATAITRLAVPCVSEITVNTVSIPNEEMKGRIIGREGRNIRALERATGISFIIDDTPGAIVLSGFDPIRMQVAKMAITDLVQDGRVHPTRIEESVERAKINLDKLIKKHGEDAALRLGIINLHPELVTLVGKLKFRYSYGQNILDHSIEVANLMGIMAAELGLDVRLAKRIGLLHDFGKALSHEVEGSHAIIGHNFALKYGESKEVANGIGCHHGEMEPTTIEASLCSAADAISASRQGARSEFLEEYIKRLKRLEDIACAYDGVERAYAMQAGKEIRVVVLPDQIDDDGVVNLAKDLTKQIEEELNYPGKIKVTVIREKRAIEYAM